MVVKARWVLKAVPIKGKYFMVSIPKVIADAYHLQKGDDIELVIDDGDLKLILPHKEKKDT